MRAYFFVNSWLSGIQKGLQTAHCVAEIAMDSTVDEDMDRLFTDWAISHKTIVILEGGSCEALRNIADHMHRKDNPYPWAQFREDGESLNGALTCVGVVVGDKFIEIYNEWREQGPLLDMERLNQPSDWEKEFIEKYLMSAHLAS